MIRELCRSERNGIDIESYFALSVLSYSRECTRGVVLAALALALAILFHAFGAQAFSFFRMHFEELNLFRSSHSSQPARQIANRRLSSCSPPAQLFSQFKSLDLSGRSVRQLRNENILPRPFESRQCVFTPCSQLSLNIAHLETVITEHHESADT